LPKTQLTCWLNVGSPDAAVNLINAAKTQFDAQLTAFELVSETALGLVLSHIPDTQRPTEASPWYVLAEFSDADPVALEQWLAARLESGEVSDGVIAQSALQAKKLWALRENISEAQKIEGVSIKHDVSVPVASIPEFLTRADAALSKAFPGIRFVSFGHVGDGNLHYNLSKANKQENSQFIASQPDVNRIVHDIVHALNGSISAEHGIGQLKREELLRYKSPVEMALMRTIKQALDPSGLMNPGKVL
jgi:FAD/FMN-containing dehydrogenase